MGLDATEISTDGKEKLGYKVIAEAYYEGAEVATPSLAPEAYAALTGQTMDIFVLFMTNTFTYDSSSNIVRYTFQ